MFATPAALVEAPLHRLRPHPPPPSTPPTNAETLPWARFQVKEVIGDLPVVSYVVRNETVGGGAPAVCDAPPGQYIIVPSTFRLTYYACE